MQGGGHPTEAVDTKRLEGIFGVLMIKDCCGMVDGWMIKGREANWLSSVQGKRINGKLRKGTQ